MTTPIPQTENQVIRDSEFVKLTMTFTNQTDQIVRYFYFGTGFRAETFNNPTTGNPETYADLGALVGISSYQRDITSSGYDTTVALTGVDPLYIYLVAGGPATDPIPVYGQDPIPVGYFPLIKGSQIQVFRGFYDDDYNLVNVIQRYSGLVTSYSINENRDQSWDLLENTYTIAIHCSSYKKILENRIAGRKTNTQSWKYFNDDDTSMDRVAAIENTQFDFGKAV